MAIRYENSLCLHGAVFISYQIRAVSKITFRLALQWFHCMLLASSLSCILRSAPLRCKARRIDNEVPY